MTAKQQLTPQLTPKSPKQPQIDTSELPLDLAEIAAVWPSLPELVRAAVVTMVKAYVSQQLSADATPSQSAQNDVSQD